jgi:hypothetical protein
MSHNERPDEHLNTLTTDDVKIASTWGASSRRFHSWITITSLGLRAGSSWTEAVARGSTARALSFGGSAVLGATPRERPNSGRRRCGRPNRAIIPTGCGVWPPFGERQAGRLKTITSAPSLSTLADTNCQPSRWRCATMSVADRLASSCRAAFGTSTIP